jgi:hypothetical protein
MLLPIFPFPFILIIIRISHIPIAISTTILIRALIHTTIRPRINPIPMLLVLLPVALILLPILTLVLNAAIKHIIFEGASIYAPALEECALPVLFVVQELPNIPSFVWINCLSRSIWHVVLPLSFILVVFLVDVDPVAIRYIVFYITLIVTAICLDIPTLPLTSPLNECALQVIIIPEVEFAKTMRFFIRPLPYILGSQIVQKYLFLWHHNIPFLCGFTQW